MIADCFLWFREIDMLELRLRMLDGLADVFVIAEADRTFQGDVKGHRLWDHKARLGPWVDRIVYLPVSLPEGAVTWQAEALQREVLAEGARETGADVVVFSDVDEVWGPEMPAKWAKEVLVARHDFRKMSLYWRWGAPFSWPGSIGGPAGMMLGQSWQQLRDDRYHLPWLASGWHFSWMGEVEDIRVKARSFSHHEYRDLPFEELAAEGRWIDGHLEQTDHIPDILPWVPSSWLRRVD